MNHKNRQYIFVDERGKELALTFTTLLESGKVIVRLIDLVNFLGISSSAQIVKKLEKIGKYDLVERYTGKNSLIKVGPKHYCWQYYTDATNIFMIAGIFSHCSSAKLDSKKFIEWLQSCTSPVEEKEVGHKGIIGEKLDNLIQSINFMVKGMENISTEVNSLKTELERAKNENSGPDSTQVVDNPRFNSKSDRTNAERQRRHRQRIKVRLEGSKPDEIEQRIPSVSKNTILV